MVVPIFARSLTTKIVILHAVYMQYQFLNIKGAQTLRPRMVAREVFSETN